MEKAIEALGKEMTAMAIKLDLVSRAAGLALAALSAEQKAACSQALRQHVNEQLERLDAMPPVPHLEQELTQQLASLLESMGTPPAR